jgi:hypothetical protein
MQNAIHCGFGPLTSDYEPEDPMEKLVLKKSE